MADVASNSSRYNPFPALTELPDPLSRVAFPSEVVMPWSTGSSELIPLWNPATDSPSDVQLNLLAWLAHHSTAANKGHFTAADKHLVFAHSKYMHRCVWIQWPSVCISVRLSAFKAGAYSSVMLGTRAGEDAGDKRIVMDVHRLMCLLTKGPPPFAGAVAKHARVCTDKACINPGHLEWGTQSANTKESSGARVASRTAAAGAVAPLVLCGIVDGRCRVIFRSFGA